MRIIWDTALGKAVIAADDGTEHVLHDTADLGAGIFALYHYPGVVADTGAVAEGGVGPIRGEPGHVAYGPDGRAPVAHDPERLYGRDGTVRGAVLIGYVATHDTHSAGRPGLEHQISWPEGERAVYRHADGVHRKDRLHPHTGAEGTVANTFIVR